MRRGLTPRLADAARRVPIRWRLTITFGAVMAILLAGLIAFIYFRFRSDLDDNIDAALRARAQDVAGLVRRQDPTQTRAALARLTRSEDNVVQVLSARGTVLASTTGPTAPALLRATEVAPALRAPRLLDRGESLRVYALPVPADRRIVVVGVSLAQRDAALDKLDRALLLGVPIALGLACVAAYLLAAAALAPVERMRRRAATISADEIATRLPLPAAEDEISRLGTTLNEMLDRLQAALHHEREFVANASHELRMPLAVLRAELEVALRERGGEPGLRSAIGSAIEETDRISALAEDLLLLARAQDGTLPVDLRPLAVGELLADLGEAFSPLVAHNGRSLVVRRVQNGARVHADQDRVQQAIGNLVENALRYGAGEITLSARVDGDAVEFHVSDFGEGFDELFLPVAFDRFTRSDPARARGGVGLGLAVVLMVAHAHGGRVGAANAPGGGADVWLALPSADGRSS